MIIYRDTERKRERGLLRGLREFLPLEKCFRRHLSLIGASRRFLERRDMELLS